MVTHRYQKIHEPIKVATTSGERGISVRKFKWRDQVYQVTEQTLTAKAMRGADPVWLFSVLTDYGSYKLRLDTSTLHWWLEEIYSEL